MRRAWRARARVGVTTMPASTLREHDGRQHPGALHLDHAHPAGVLGREGVAVAEGGDVEPGGPGTRRGAWSPRAPGGLSPSMVSSTVRWRRADDHGGRDWSCSCRNDPRRLMAESMADAGGLAQAADGGVAHGLRRRRPAGPARRPRWPAAGRRPAVRGPPPGGRSPPGRGRTARRTRPGRRRRCATGSRPESTVSSRTMTTPDPSVAPAAGAPSKVRGKSRPSGATKAPAAPPSSTARRTALAGSQPPASSISSARVAPKGTSYTPGCRTGPDTANSLVPVERSVPTAA